MFMRIAAAVCAVLLGAAGAALAQSGAQSGAQPGAQSGPPLAPTRDFIATYRMTGEQDMELRMSWLTSGGVLRLDTPQGALLQDTRRNRTTILMTEQRMFVEDDSDEDQGPGIGLVKPGSRVTRLGAERIAGHDCTVWRIEEPKEDPEDEAEVTQACVTEDGVPLRTVEMRGKEEKSRTIATRLEYARQDPARFRVPEGYRPFDPSVLNQQPR
jgi:hypothetical protein